MKEIYFFIMCVFALLFRFNFINNKEVEQWLFGEDLGVGSEEVSDVLEDVLEGSEESGESIEEEGSDNNKNEENV